MNDAADNLEADLRGSTPSPQRILIETFDFVELCCGQTAPLMRAVGRAGLRCGPRIDILAHEFWDLSQTRVVEWLLFLANNRRVWHWHSGVPCTDFSVAKHPKPRRGDAPWGIDLAHPDRQLPNFCWRVRVSSC